MKVDIYGKEFLNRVPLINKKINRKLATIEVLKSERDSVSVVLKERVQTSGVSDFGDMCVKVIDMEREVEELLKKRAEIKFEILEEIKKLGDDEEITLLIKVYLQDKTLSQVSKEEHWSYSRAKKLHGIALENFRRIRRNGH